jgi:hypothetical protein
MAGKKGLESKLSTNNNNKALVALRRIIEPLRVKEKG